MGDHQENGVQSWRTHPWLGAHLFWENRNKVPLETLQPYNHMRVAWFPDGSGIRDADVDGHALWKRIEASGDDPSWFCYEYIELDAVL
jgi:hypothetical protein